VIDRSIAAAIFDMDGTLVDSEHLTRRVIDDLFAAHALDASGVRDEDLHGVTWGQIAADLVAGWPPLRGACSGPILHARCQALWLAEPPPPLPGVIDALRDARAAGLRIALATSSQREAADALLERDGFRGAFDAVVTADDIERSKPDPQIFLLAAERLGVPADRCLVFEDSLAGLRAAAAAGMSSIAVLLRCAAPRIARSLAGGAIVDFSELPDGCFGRADRTTLIPGPEVEHPPAPPGSRRS
jgi:HAD superfamily hydrolase (TIGR01509 family)